MNRGVIILILASLVLPQASFASGEGINLPENWGDIKAMAQRVFDALTKDLPAIIMRLLKEEALPIWQKMGDWFKKNIFEPYIYPFFKKEIEPRKPIIEEEFEKEKEDIKTELPQLIKSLWEKLKDLIK